MRKLIRNASTLIYYCIAFSIPVLVHIYYNFTVIPNPSDVLNPGAFFKIFSLIWMVALLAYGFYKKWLGFEWFKKSNFEELFDNACMELKFFKFNPNNEDDILFPVSVKGNTALITTKGQTEAFLNRVQDFSDATGLMLYRVGRAYHPEKGELPGIIKMNFTDKGLTTNIKFSDIPKTKFGDLVIGKTVDGWMTKNINDLRYTLAFGEQGSGKTSFSESMMLQVYQFGLPLILMDFKNNERYGQLNKIGNIITTGDKWEAYHILTVLDQISAFRSRQITRQGKQHYYQCKPAKVGERIIRINYPIILFIDELYLALEGKKGASAMLLNGFTRLATQKRSQGIFAHFITQYPDKQTLEGGFRPNISAYFGFRSEDAVMNMIFNKYKDLKISQYAKGRMFTDANVDLEQVQSPYLKEGQLKQRMKELNKNDSNLIRYLKSYVKAKQEEHSKKQKPVKMLAI